MANEIFNSEYSAEQIENAIANAAPMVGANGNWWLWDIVTMAWVDTLIKARAEVTGAVTDVNGKQGSVTTGSLRTITLSSWVDNEAVYSDPWIQEGFAYTISYTDASFALFKAHGIRSKTENENGEIVFYCDSTPSEDVEVRVLKVAIDD